MQTRYTPKSGNWQVFAGPGILITPMSLMGVLSEKREHADHKYGTKVTEDISDACIHKRKSMLMCYLHIDKLVVKRDETV